METKRFHSLAYNKFYFNPNYKVVEPSKLVNVMPYLGISKHFFWLLTFLVMITLDKSGLFSTR